MLCWNEWTFIKVGKRERERVLIFHRLRKNVAVPQMDRM